MISEETIQIISHRLISENICHIPLDEASLGIIDDYMRYIRSDSDLCRRLADIELNYVQISSEAQSAYQSSSETKEMLQKHLRVLTDSWNSKGVLRDFVFSYNEEEIGFIKYSYASALECMRNSQSIITEHLMTISETAAQIRACSASFTEVYKESKLAVYAAMLNRNVQDVLDCRAISLQAHASASECERYSSRLLGFARNCTRIISIINKLIINTSEALGFDYDKRIIHPNSAYNAVCEAMNALNNIKFEN